MAGKAVVTGGTGGIGFHVAMQLQQSGFAVTVVGRDQTHGEEAVQALGADARFIQADLSSLKQVRELGARLAAEGPLQLLVNNVGGMWSRRWVTVDGIEASFAVNHLTPVVLTRELLDALRAGAPSRVVDVTSSSITVAAVAGELTFEEVEQDGEYFGMAVAGRAKLAHLAHNQDLAEALRGSGVTVLAADPLGPAAAATPNAAEMTPEILPPPVRHLWDQIQAGLRPASDVARPIVVAATDPALAGAAGVVIGPDAAPSDELLTYLSSEASASARALTRRVLAEVEGS
ncbi:SDR family NAD(P)-dependent oxidoreductase [Micromonospora sp. WMMD1155]|uniref:SDR family NAD(P)-dependent oxidoreductase n=1 Tax=Micromonospora sp. WMMD1155 TaxID=3016094 RepID=UPI002499DED8|nr:SDR family NAD(P)-dependent oxidoreductase [Micromonospora sp. WMMD1155]WFE53263.1 SDR family NAD(P)-dependent oxidoreductase [Micromonospora sp. WMMD1155]